MLDTRGGLIQVGEQVNVSDGLRLWTRRRIPGGVEHETWLVEDTEIIDVIAPRTRTS
jgi:hypothetical protein